jgi:DNA-3-methyladenine glycosylase I
MLTGYCKYCAELPADNVHRHYHDNLYGFPIADDFELFGRFLLEINQAGLSWDTILKKEANFRKAYHDFDYQKIARYTTNDRERLLSDSGIIRNKLKVNAAIHNAQRIMELVVEFKTFGNWLDVHHPLSREQWTQLFKKNFTFTGGEIVNEFLMSTGYLPGAHCESCTIFDEILKKQPKWQST